MNPRIPILLVLACSIGLTVAPTGSCQSQSTKAPSLPRYVCQELPTVPTGDWPSDAAWRTLPSTGLFVLAEDGQKTREKTEARMGWTRDGIYIRWTCTDPHIWIDYKNRDDELWNEEVVEVFLALSKDPYRYFEFEVSPNNLIVDLDIRWSKKSGALGMVGDKDWDSKGSRSRVELDGTLNDPSDVDRGWTADLFVPFADMGVKAPKKGAPSPTWRVNFYRIERQSKSPSKNDEYSAWSPTLTSPPAYHTPPRFGFLTFTHRKAK